MARALAEPTGGLCQIVGDHPGCIRGDDRTRLLTADALSEDVEGNLWIGASNQLMRWRDGSFETYLRELEGFTVSSVTSIAAAADGSVWTAIPRKDFGVFRIVNGRPNRAEFPGINTAHITSLFIDLIGRSGWEHPTMASTERTASEWIISAANTACRATRCAAFLRIAKAIGNAARKLDQYAARKVSHLRGRYSTPIDRR